MCRGELGGGDVGRGAVQLGTSLWPHDAIAGGYFGTRADEISSALILLNCFLGEGAIEASVVGGGEVVLLDEEGLETLHVSAFGAAIEVASEGE